jgi:hypothetical protein
VRIMLHPSQVRKFRHYRLLYTTELSGLQRPICDASQNP